MGFLLENPPCKVCQPPDILVKPALRAMGGWHNRPYNARGCITFVCSTSCRKRTPNILLFYASCTRSIVGPQFLERVEREGFKAIRPGRGYGWLGSNSISS